MRSIFRRPAPFDPARLGPSWVIDDPNAEATELDVTTGALAGTRLAVRQSVQNHRADFELHLESDTIGHIHIDRDTESGLETLWDIFVHPRWRQRGLSSLLVRLSFRRLLAVRGRHWFGVRKMMKVDTRRLELHNIGIGVICLKLGMLPEAGLEQLFSPGNIKAVKVLPATDAAPPGLMLSLARLPGVVVAARIDSESKCPVADENSYRRFLNPQLIAREAAAGRALVGNIDYLLARGNAAICAHHLAATDGEYRRFKRILGTSARRLGGRGETARAD